ncbi:hypothetical protein HAP48_0000555 (plasmid) [Bradyrhizobium septentrionale]|uniref:Uncharacterized protein n=1 Tax=Bradyrhizobium septentrionale TaxID=1404411 RepID=A0A974A6M0_9BRAD|nr:hypothetical protein [Bradyrhizobium septentrionale]UGY11968.1 hypothetical protein HAP48_0000555 [Bradyrhizobium septentrionale]UGY30169.1 hypothetical protein HU675_0047940 [Bradyrhizobium septentrionale]
MRIIPDLSGGLPSVHICSISPDDAPQAHPDSLNEKGAIALAKWLEQFWHGKGYLAARFWAEPIGERFAKIGTHDLYRVSCNLVNGLPPRYRDATN